MVATFFNPYEPQDGGLNPSRLENAGKAFFKVQVCRVGLPAPIRGKIEGFSRPL